MDVSQNITLQSPVLWELDKDNQPEDPILIIEPLTFLINHPEWVRENETETRQFINLLAQTDHLNIKAMATQNTLIYKFPTLFSMVTVKIGTVERQIPKERLSRNEKFQVELSCGFKESQTSVINLSCPEDIKDKEVFNSLLTYLAGGKVRFTGKNAIDLMRLAQEHNLQALVGECALFIGKNLDIPSFKEILQAAFDYHLKDLKWQCFIFASQQQTIDVNLLTDIEMSEKVKRILQNPCAWYFEPSISDGKKSLHFMWGITFTPEIIEILKGIHEECGIEELRSVYCYKETISSLTELSEFIPNLYSLKMLGFVGAKLPDIWLQNLKSIYCDHISGFSRFDAPEAEKIELHENPQSPCMNILNVPKAKYIKCHRFCSLESIFAPQAEEVVLKDCHNLTKFDATHVKRLEMDNTGNMLDINAVNAEWISCTNSAINTLHAPVAKFVDCHGSSLKSLDVPKARTILCNDCDFISSVNAPFAKEVECSHCPNLRKLIVAEGCKITGKHKLPNDCQIIYVPKV